MGKETQLQGMHRTRARSVLGGGRMKVRKLSFSVIKPKITNVSQLAGVVYLRGGERGICLQPPC